MKSHLHVAVLSLVLFLSAFPSQCRQSSSNNVSFHKVYFVNEHDGWILGSTSKESSILQSIDGGETWQQRYRCSEGLFNIKFANHRVGWVVGSNGSILRTSDGGANWARQKSGVNVLLTGLAVLDMSNAWVTGALGTLLYTRDGGETWNRRDIKSQVGISDIVFLDSERGWAVGYGTILSTTDGGKTWDMKSSGEWKPLSSIFFANQNLGWITVGPVLLKTTDAGKTWAETLPPSQGQLAGLSFVDAQHGWVAKSRGEEGSVVHIPGKETLSSESFVLSTNDGGQTWQTIFHVASQVDHSAWILNVFFINGTNGWAVGRDGLIMRTVDAGKNWRKTQLTLIAENPKD
jgi:photosystem II stability/assembly factor-like uncharacterized protein